MKIGKAIKELQKGNRVARAYWDGDFLMYVPGSEIVVNPGTPYYKAGLEDVSIEPHIDLYKDCCASVQVGWSFSQADILATDWVIVE